MIKKNYLHAALALGLSTVSSHAVAASDLTQAEANTIFKEDLASVQVLSEICPKILGANATFDNKIQKLIQSYISDFTGPKTSLESLQNDSEYKSILNEARSDVQQGSADEQKSACTDVLAFES